MCNALLILLKVCSSPVDPADDFIQLSAMADYKPKTRWVNNKYMANSQYLK